MAKAKQHYVPQSILRNFKFNPGSKNQSSKVFVLDKKENEVVTSNVKDIACEKDYYNKNDSVKTNETDYDSFFDSLDSDIAPIICKIINNQNIDCIDAGEREFLDKFTACQYLRTPAIRKIAETLNCTDKDKIREYHAQAITGSGSEISILESLATVFNKLQISLVEAHDDNQFIIGDSPVLHDPTANGIYFPISPKYCLFYHKGNNNPLNVVCINRLIFLASENYIYGNTRKDLENVSNNLYGHQIDTFCTSQDSYWKCILAYTDPSYCINLFKNDIYEPLAKLL